MEKINIAELLRDCPNGMELDCSVFEDVTLYKIDTDIENEFPIRIKTKNDYFLDLTKYGTYSNVEEAKCVIFPKGKTTWRGFQRPFNLKDGKLVPNKFDIKNLKPFDRVLVRPDSRHHWSTQFFERTNKKLRDSFVCVGGLRYYQCIPYEGNEHLLDTAIECNNFYKNWD